MEKEIIYKKARLLENFSKILHGFFGKEGGVSSGPFESLNLSPFLGDSLSHVTENKNRILKALGTGNVLFLMDQIHSADVCVLDSKNFDAFLETPPCVDGVVTQLTDVVLGVLTADCASVLWASPDASVIGACHAGWRGTKKGIIENTFQKMCFLGANPSEIHVTIGPMIQKSSYEVKKNLYEALRRTHPCAIPFFQIKDPTELTYRFDLQGWICAKLKALGITKIECINEDTYPSDSQYFSYRQAKKDGNLHCGRNLSGIAFSESCGKL
jgi:YfiH family protein